MRTTAIVHVTRHACGCEKLPAGHLRYEAKCKDCGARSESHLRVLLDGPPAGWVQVHRRECPAMAVAR